ncbi:MAG: hypothetical protein AAGA37_05850 [Actinomycetota bacterium]
MSGIATVSFGTTAALLPLVEQLCDDERVDVFVGDGVTDLEFTHAAR